MTAGDAPTLLLGIRAMRVFWRMLVPLVLLANGVLWAHLLGADSALRAQVWTVVAYLGGFALLDALVREVLSPARPGMRLIPMANHRAERLTTILRIVLVVLLGAQLVIYLVGANGWRQAVATLVALIRDCGLLLFVYLGLARTGLFQRLQPPDTNSYPRLVRRIVLRWVLPTALLTALFCVIARALGYLQLSDWVMRRAGLSVLVVLVAAVIYRWVLLRIRAAVRFMQAERIEAGQEPSAASIGVERIALGALRVVTGLVALLTVLSVWELDPERFAAWLATPIFSGGPTWGEVIRGTLAVAAVLLAGALVRTVLIFFVFPRSKVDAGARYAVLTIWRYIVFVAAALIGLDALGVKGSAFAVFAGAFGVGLGFGLQDIFANFFSGLIMLIERPVQVGDMVEVGGQGGTVEAIRLRGTTIRTFEKTTVIIPNRAMIGERLKNLTQDLEIVRLEVQVGVSYDSDLRQAERVLIETAHRDERILDDPPPFVRVQAFADSSVNLVLWCHTSLTADRWQIQHELRIGVFEALRGAAIEIPFPQRDVHIRHEGLPPGTAPPAISP